MRPKATAAPGAEISAKDLEALLDRTAGVLPSDDLALIERIVATLLQLTALIRQQGTTIARLRRLVGGVSSEKTEKVLPPPPDPKQGGEDSSPPSAGEPKKPPAKGHGRIPASAYPGAQHIAVKHASLAVGVGCPHCLGSTLYGLEPVGVLRIFGQAPLVPKIWDLEHLRCCGCGSVFTAQAPPEAQGEKFDYTAVAMMVLLRYGNGQPLHRLDHLQDYLEIPVPASTQWQVVNESTVLFQPVYDELLRRAAQSPLLHNDDTYLRILELMGKRRAASLAKGELDDPERTGLFTTGVVAKTEDGKPIVLFFSGRKHAGENLANLLRQRAAELPSPTLMSDALDRNRPKGHAVDWANCLCHGRRNLVDQIANFPAECRFLLEALREVFQVDARCEAEKLPPQERLCVHQRESGPVMERIKAKSSELLDQKAVEPNSDMGKALQYLLTHWEALTLFLFVPGAPLHNNVCERILKMAIRHRNNSLFYRSQRGAVVGDLFMTLIETTVENDENPFEYLTALQRHSKEVAERPSDWLPWTFRSTLARLDGSVPDGQDPVPSTPPPTSPQEVAPAAPVANLAASTEPRCAPQQASARGPGQPPGPTFDPAPTQAEVWESALHCLKESGPRTLVPTPRTTAPRCGDP